MIEVSGKDAERLRKKSRKVDMVVPGAEGSRWGSYGLRTTPDQRQAAKDEAIRIFTNEPGNTQVRPA